MNPAKTADRSTDCNGSARVNVWIIYDSAHGHCKKLGETIGDLLEGDCDVSVGYARKISPGDVIAETPKAVLVGGPMHWGKPSMTIATWIKHFYQLVRKLGIQVQKAAVFCTWGVVPDYERPWRELLGKYQFAKNIFPQVLSVKVQGQGTPLIMDDDAPVYDDVERLRRFLLGVENKEEKES